MVCNVSARSPEDIARLLAQESIATPAATTGGQTLPEGEPVDAATSAAIDKTVRQWLACQNAGESLRAWALFSDGYLYRLLSRQAEQSASDFQALATPDLTSPGSAEIEEIQGERVLPDGRYGATVMIAYESVPMPKTFFIYFTRDDGRVLIDGILGEISFSVP